MTQGHQNDGRYKKLSFHWHILDDGKVLMHSRDEKIIRQKFTFFKASERPGENITLEPPEKPRAKPFKRWLDNKWDFEREGFVNADKAPLNSLDFRLDDD